MIHTARGQRLRDLGTHPIRRADRDRRLVDHDAIAIEMRSHRACHREYMTKIRRAVLIGWRTDRDQDHLTVRDAGRRIGREGQTTRSGIAGDQ